ncbi:hypothetical protein QTO34_001888 [Cnephaeus nilssonii]|uniref:Uncharacterized protein n=1 Tax=Cnephaeus nilssonii TaxID=3371016 RepID=A0AA40HTP3_CNENI|nr:hypothetical protein QTO34_001888 [Eptesicus nilssonii]
MKQLNGILLHLASELARPGQSGRGEALLNIKVKLEAEISTYCNLLEEGVDLYLSDALDNRNSLQSIQKTTTCRIVDSKVVSEVNDPKVLRC